MKPLEKSGGLVDFKENLIFQREKDLAIESSDKFYKKLRDVYSYDDDRKKLSMLYRKIVNYQIEKYGAMLSDSDCHYGKFTKEEYIKIRNNKRYRFKHRKNK